MEVSQRTPSSRQPRHTTRTTTQNRYFNGWGSLPTPTFSFKPVLCFLFLLLLVVVPDRASSDDSSYYLPASAGTPRQKRRALQSEPSSLSPGGSRDGDADISPSRNLTPRRQPPSCADASCTSQKNISCKISKHSEFCMHRDESPRDFPGPPRELEVNHSVVGNQTYFNISWRPPHDMSYAAVKGYELLITTFSRHLGPHVDCIFVNLSSTDWALVNNIHDVVFFVDCWRIHSSLFRKVQVKIFSYPKPAGNHDEKSMSLDVYPDPPTVPAKFAWEAKIDAHQWNENRSLVVLVSPKLDRIDYIKVCITTLHEHSCKGDVSGMESPRASYRYSVKSLSTNQSYFVYVRPYDKDNLPLDVWIHKTSPIFIEPWPEGPVQTPATPVQPGGSGVTVVLVTLVILAFGALTAAAILWHKGYLRNIWLLRCCSPTSAFAEQPIKLLQLYVAENSLFQPVLARHRDLLGQHLTLDCEDVGAMRGQHDPDRWLSDQCRERRVILYLSPQIMDALRAAGGEGDEGVDCRGQEEALPPAAPAPAPPLNPVAIKCVQLLHKVNAAEDLRLRGGRGSKSGVSKGPVLVFTGCFPSDVADERDLAQHPALRGVQRFWLSKGGRLEPLSALLAKLSGCHHSPNNNPPGDWRDSPPARSLREALERFNDSVYAGHHYVDLNEMVMHGGHHHGDMGDHHPHHHGDARGLLNGGVGVGSGGGSGGLTGDNNHVYSSLPPAKDNNRGPHRTDSGFSSAANRGSNPSSEGNNSPGAAGFEEPGDGSSETSAMLGHVSPLITASQFFFVPPETIDRDDESYVLDIGLDRVNRAGESHWGERVPFVQP